MSSNAYWYIGLSIVSLVVLTIVLVRAKAVRAVFFVLIMTQMAYLIETVIYIFGNSYFYRPGFLKDSAYYDSNMGALASNMLVIPTAALLIAVYRLQWRGILVAIALIGAIEWLWVKLELYTLYWWRIEYTAIGLTMYFPFARIVYERLRRPAAGLLHSALLFLCVAPILGTLHIVPIMLFMNRGYDPGWYGDPAHDTTAFSAIYYVVMSLVIVTATKMRRGAAWVKALAIALIIFGVTRLLLATDLLRIYAWWDPWYYCLFPPVVYLLLKPISARLARGG
ncbi:hypothetical protein [Paenibacillus methanolicus]|uniref:Uncharacterized protein n=1 Tax=Paenibacillus methanolicus TaxID=582686 RepID=A0A5S5C1P3_9BACL|nr:hypothetical protein [Paenibacillus methanolicus]TYP73355.1 hypothetical protein BCM02_107339 [Paenibacillus methanolicus]